MFTVCEKGKEMNSHHILYECEALETIRLNSFQKLIELTILEDGPDNPLKFKFDLKAKHLVQFLMNIRFARSYQVMTMRNKSNLNSPYLGFIDNLHHNGCTRLCHHSTVGLRKRSKSLWDA